MATHETITLPEGVRPLSPHLVCDGAADAIEFYVAAFGAVELMRLANDDGKIMHACLAINGGSVMLVDENPDYGMRSPISLGGTPVTIHLAVDDVDSLFDRAVAAGATVVEPIENMFWGDRYGVVSDPFGHQWSIATPQGEPMTTDDLRAAATNAPPMP
jgi:PhnB protein